jgi:hypothetical protein
MAQESPAEKMHNRILNGTWFSTQDVTAADFQRVATRAGTLKLLEVRRALEKLREAERIKVNV